MLAPDGASGADRLTEDFADDEYFWLRSFGKTDAVIERQRPKAEVVQGPAADGAGERAVAGGPQSSDFAEVERAWIEALREVGVLVRRSSAVA